MTRIVILPLDFMNDDGTSSPSDPVLYEMALAYCSKELKDGVTLDLRKLTKCWLAVVMDRDQYQEVVGISGFNWRLDVPLFRVTGTESCQAMKRLISRMRCFFQDNGARGGEVFVHLSANEKPEQRCAKWKESLEAIGAVPADRFLVKI